MTNIHAEWLRINSQLVLDNMDISSQCSSKRDDKSDACSLHKGELDNHVILSESDKQHIVSGLLKGQLGASIYSIFLGLYLGKDHNEHTHHLSNIRIHQKRKTEFQTCLEMILVECLMFPVCFAP